ncbi:trypsin-like peptidase domain-containing protein [Sediminibacterium ginsengisoli]|uniref:Do/DeqQ family serine protease n=1 Tax=Sediminibacterium ginsengisoli TaxID=413434 RepID=A0A1T4QRH8_9BACT|nr:trypsin-like peptidase domain-containing protein [Sediminibacterium ginsengisoli]SKA06362.1 Do/DeqQ family serine protease [Sediminibacterium ginsengisoli]
MNLKNILATVAISACTAVVSIWGYGKYAAYQHAGVQEPGKLPVNYAGFFNNGNTPAVTVDFTPAATTATPAVVHIKTKTKARQVSNSRQQRRNPFADLFGDDFGDVFGGPRIIPEQAASGSGVLITEDGYIVTNNHVVDGADEINVTLANKKSYKATVIGSDPSSDIAVIKIEGKSLPYLVYGNSDEVKLGQWVLAIGYPLSLDVTVTAGIVSAKSRSIGINRQQSQAPVESFIQTDAAVNPGNSGGALINTSGELIGINSAIASPTGSYAGYSYAIPVNIVKKIVTDIVKFGTVQRAYIGINYPPLENMTDAEKRQLEQELGIALKEGEGVYITDVPEGGAAAIAGLKKGDVVTKINNIVVTGGPELQEQVARFKPGDKITLTYTRGGKESTINVVLKNKAGNTEVVKNASVIEKLGGTLENVDKKIAAANEIAGGVLVKKVGEGLLKKSRMQDGFVITGINGKEIKSLDELKEVLAVIKRGTVRFDGLYPGFEGSYTYPVSLGDD